MEEIISLNFKSTVLLLMNLGIDDEFSIEIEEIHTAFDKGDMENALACMCVLNELIVEKFEIIH